MPFSPHKLGQVQRGIRHALESNTLSKWERDFLLNMQAKLSRFGCKTQLSHKQYRRLIQLVAAYVPDIGSEGRESASSLLARNKSTWTKYVGTVATVVVLIGFVIFKAVERFPEYLGPLVILTAIETISGRTTHVRDGDTIEVSGTPIRFGSLDCAESGTAKGRQATARMRELVVGERLTCYLNGRTSYDRKIGSCRLKDGRDVAGIMVREGYCRRYW